MSALSFTTTVLLGIIAISLVSASNYEEYLANSLAKNIALRDDYFSRDPYAQSVMEKLADHPSLRDLDDYSSSNDLTAEEWEQILRLISQNEVPEKDGDERIELVERESVQPRSSEEMYQNHLNGEHRIIGGSSEVGAWLDYALEGAGAQDDEEETGGTESGEALGGDVKTDSLPGYCDPPNPCPIGYDPRSLSAPCDEGVQNTKEFNIEWNYQKIMNGECSCDSEHMNSCPKSIALHRDAKLSPFMRGQKRSRLVAKKSIHRMNKRSSPNVMSRNPYLGGMVLKRVSKKSGPKAM